MRPAAHLIGEHDFTSFRATECQAASPVKTLRALDVHRRGAYWRFDFDGSAFLHHMVRNNHGLLAGGGQRPRERCLDGRGAARPQPRRRAAPTFAADGLYFVGPYYDSGLAIPEHTPAMDWRP